MYGITDSAAYCVAIVATEEMAKAICDLSEYAYGSCEIDPDNMDLVIAALRETASKMPKPRLI